MMISEKDNWLKMTERINIVFTYASIGIFIYFLMKIPKRKLLI